jgi:hypothetical protein
MPRFLSTTGFNRITLLVLFLAFTASMSIAGSPEWAWDQGSYEQDGTVTMDGEDYSINPTGHQSLTGKSVRQPPTVIVQTTSSSMGAIPFCVEAQGPAIPGYGRVVSSTAATCYVPTTIEGHIDGSVIKGVSANGPNSNWAAAISYCENLIEGGYNNWKLPTIVELDALYALKNEIGGFISGYYWSASEYNADSAWIVNFSDGTRNNFGKTTASAVRCVRH